MRSSQVKAIVLVSAILSIGFGGCGNKFFDPTQVGRFRPVPAVNMILDSLGVAEETPVAWESAEEPRPSDVVAIESDYTFRSGDVVRVSIFELEQQGTPFVNDYVVTETGKISIPDVGVIQAGGLTETQLEDEVRQILKPSILKDPAVVATLQSSQQRTYSIIGNGVPSPGRYGIPRYDFRLTDALATAGGPAQFNVSYIYVARRLSDQYEGGGSPNVGQPEAPGMKTAVPRENLELKTIEPKPTEPKITTPGDELNTTEPQMTLPETDKPGQIELPEIVVPDTLDKSAPNDESTDSQLKSERNTLELITPRAQLRQKWPASKVVIATSEMINENELGGLLAPDATSDEPKAVQTQDNSQSTDLKDKWPDLDRVMKSRGVTRSAPTASKPASDSLPQIGLNDLAETSAAPAAPAKTESTTSDPIRWVYKDGKWVPATTATTQPAPAEPAKVEPAKPQPMTTQPAKAQPDLTGVLDQVEQPKTTQPAQPLVQKNVEPVGPNELEPEPLVGEVGVDQAMKDTGGQIEWVFKDGKWVPVQVGAAKAKPEPKVEGAEPVQEKPAKPTDEEWDEAIQYRLIRIPADKLLAGDPRYNIVIKPGDSIQVPVDIIGECLVMGNVNRQGYINITGRPMTLKMAIAAAGGLGPLAWPKRVEVIRRIGEKKEEIVLVDLEKIANGEQPDFFIKPNDLINVGTDPSSRWRAVLRNSFRATYGFGFVYDRNFADRDYGHGPLPF